MNAPDRNRQLVALVTGCSQGLGPEIVLRLAEQGCVVVATHRTSPDGIEFSHEAGTATYHEKMDIRDESQVEDVVQSTLLRFGRIDILVNNAGVYLDQENQPMPEMLPLELLTATLDVNVMGAARTMRAVIPAMVKQHSGCIVNVSSGMGRTVELSGDALYYRTSKAALTALTRCVAQRVAHYGIVVNAVCPGWVRTRMGGADAVRSVHQGADGIVAAALYPRKNGALLRDNEDFGW